MVNLSLAKKINITLPKLKAGLWPGKDHECELCGKGISFALTWMASALRPWRHPRCTCVVFHDLLEVPCLLSLALVLSIAPISDVRFDTTQ